MPHRAMPWVGDLICLDYQHWIINRLLHRRQNSGCLILLLMLLSQRVGTVMVVVEMADLMGVIPVVGGRICHHVGLLAMDHPSLVAPVGAVAGVADRADQDRKAIKRYRSHQSTCPS